VSEGQTLAQYITELNETISNLLENIPSVPESLCDIIVGDCVAFADCFGASGLDRTSVAGELIEAMMSKICESSTQITENQGLWERVFANITTGDKSVVFEQPTISFTGLTANVSEGFGMFNGVPFLINAGSVELEANRDNYIEVDTSSNLTVVSVAVGALDPGFVNLRLFKVTTDGSGVVSSSFDGNLFLFETMDLMADDVVETRHIVNENVTNEKLDNLLENNGFVGLADFLRVDYNTKGRIINATSKMDFENLDVDHIMVFNGNVWRNILYRENPPLPNLTSAEASSFGFGSQDSGTLIYNTTIGKAQVWNGSSFDDLH
jgi:hypothetical protein